MKAKRTVSLKGAVFQIGWAAGVAWGILQKLDPSKDFIVTSVNDSTHGTGSLHYIGKAIDIRTKNLTPDLTIKLYNALKAELDSQGFDVVHEVDHIHCEYDPKPSETFLKPVE